MLKTKEESDLTDEENQEALHNWAILADKGYQGLQSKIKTVVHNKNPSHGVLTNSEKRSNTRTGKDLVVVETSFWETDFKVDCFF